MIKHMSGLAIIPTGNVLSVNKSNKQITHFRNLSFTKPISRKEGMCSGWPKSSHHKSIFVRFQTLHQNAVENE